MHNWELHKRRGYAEIRPYVPGEDLTGISVSATDTPQEGGMIARNPQNAADQWYMTRERYWQNYEVISREVEQA